jgi:formylglycine-generating enzyme required for sulfatase activity
VVAETGDGITGARPVDAQREANGHGLYDTHGNVWEWVDSIAGTVRGGSWNDSVPMARSANRLALDQSTRHPLVGMRLVLVP